MFRLSKPAIGSDLKWSRLSQVRMPLILSLLALVGSYLAGRWIAQEEPNPSYVILLLAGFLIAPLLIQRPVWGVLTYVALSCTVRVFYNMSMIHLPVLDIRPMDLVMVVVLVGFLRRPSSSKVVLGTYLAPVSLLWMGQLLSYFYGVMVGVVEVGNFLGPMVIRGILSFTLPFVIPYLVARAHLRNVILVIIGIGVLTTALIMIVLTARSEALFNLLVFDDRYLDILTSDADPILYNVAGATLQGLVSLVLFALMFRAAPGRPALITSTLWMLMVVSAIVSSSRGYIAFHVVGFVFVVSLLVWTSSNRKSTPPGSSTVIGSVSRTPMGFKSRALFAPLVLAAVAVCASVVYFNVDPSGVVERNKLLSKLVDPFGTTSSSDAYRFRSAEKILGELQESPMYLLVGQGGSPNWTFAGYKEAGYAWVTDAFGPLAMVYTYGLPYLLGWAWFSWEILRIGFRGLRRRDLSSLEQSFIIGSIAFVPAWWVLVTLSSTVFVIYSRGFVPLLLVAGLLRVIEEGKDHAEKGESSVLRLF